jgi:hypothetical protein
MLVTKKYLFHYYLRIIIRGSCWAKPVDIVESSVKVGMKAEEMVYYGLPKAINSFLVLKKQMVRKLKLLR